jgi:hypothetical protein
MVRIAKKDTYATEDVGGGVEVRRRVFAGQRVPESFDVESGDVEEIDSTPSGLRFHDVVENPTSVAEGDPEPSDDKPDQVTLPDGDEGAVEAPDESEDTPAEEPAEEPDEEKKPAPQQHRARRSKADE